MKKLLVLSPRFPYPVVGGDRLRIYWISKILSQYFELTLLSLYDDNRSLPVNASVDGVFNRVETIYLPKWRSWLNCAKAVPQPTPLQVAYYTHKEFARRAAELANAHDGVLAHLVRTGGMIKDLPVPKFLEMTDAISLNYDRVSKLGLRRSSLRSQVFSIEARRLKQYERSIVDSFDHSFLVSDIDRQFLFSGQPDRLGRTSVASNGVDLLHFPFRFSQSGRDIIFIGNLTSLQNFDSVLFMAEEILPRVKSAHPDVNLRIVGRVKPSEAQKLLKHAGVIVTGEVASVADSVAGGAVGVCPMRIGAGVQNKLLEYMALGLPSVTTPLGLEGIEAVPGRDLLLAKDSASFADCVIELLNDRSLAEGIAINARHYVERTHSWEKQLRSLVDVIDRGTEGRNLISRRTRGFRGAS